MKLNNSSITKIALCETFQTPGQRIKPEVPIKKTLAGRASSLTSPPCPRPLAVLARGAAWESPTARGSGGGVLPRRLELQCWVLPLHLQGQSRLQTIRWTVTFLTICRECIWGWGLQVWNASQCQVKASASLLVARTCRVWSSLPTKAMKGQQRLKTAGGLLSVKRLVYKASRWTSFCQGFV